MVYQYQGHYSYSQTTINSWNNSQIGIYYCGYINQSGDLIPLYIGRAIGQGGIKGRLLQHLNQDRWPEVTHFGYCVCDTVKEAENLESSEIAKFKPKYNTQGKFPTY